MHPPRLLRTGLPGIAALAVLLTACGRTSFGPVSGERAREHTAKILSFGPRQPGSEGIRKVAGYIEEQLRAVDPALKLERQRFTRPDIAPGIEFENLWVEIPGQDPNGDILAIGAHYDSKITHPGEQDFEFLGALDAAASCGVLIELARHLHEKRPIGPTVWLIWIDGEESLEWDWNDDKALIGSNHFVDAMHADKERFPKGFSDRLKVFVLLDLLGDEELKIDKDTKSNPRLLDLFEATAKELGVGEIMYAYQSPMKDDHIPFKRRGVRVIDLIDFAFRAPNDPTRQRNPADAERYYPWWHTPDDELARVSARSLDIVGNLVWTALPRIETEFYE